MGISLHSVIPRAKKQNTYSRLATDQDEQYDLLVRVPKGFLAVYVGVNDKRRFVIPLSYLKNPIFKKFLKQAEEEYGFDHPIMGGLTFPCDVDSFLILISKLRNQ
ncbi:hypothetical protein Leryth_011536 [Lithospermum erythrorhizon]|uniref:Uncharacterized protein n=1 Tax=Lithospermum erythrorhizon TaxID=34254 RepID=A0AAV3P4H9_LITER|nr:hypothetical protein Leryth_011536 [Lithospermum erythrorhizon]